MTKVVLDHQEDGICLMYGLTQLCEGEKFSQTAVMLTPKEILFYDDNIPNQVVGDVHYHRARIRIYISQLRSLVVQKIKHYDYGMIYKISFLQLNSINQTTNFFCLTKDVKLLKYFLKCVHNVGVKVKNNKIIKKCDW